MAQFFFGPFEPVHNGSGLTIPTSILTNLKQVAGYDLTEHPIVRKTVADIEHKMGRKVTSFFDRIPNPNEEADYERFYYAVCYAAAVAYCVETKATISRVASYSSGIFCALPFAGYLSAEDSIVTLRDLYTKQFNHATKTYYSNKFFGSFVELPPEEEFEISTLIVGRSAAERVTIKDKRGENAYIIAGNYKPIKKFRQDLFHAVPRAKVGAIFNTYPSHTEHTKTNITNQDLKCLDIRHADMPLISSEGSQWAPKLAGEDELRRLLQQTLDAPMNSMDVFEKLLETDDQIIGIGGPKTRSIIKSVARSRPKLSSVLCF